MRMKTGTKISLIASLALCGFLALPVVAQGYGRGQGANMAVMRDAHQLVMNHARISRSFEPIPGGIRSTTTTTDPDLIEVLQRHPRAMKAHFESGGVVRMWDPLFAELARVADKVTMEVRDLQTGVEVAMTSEDAEVEKLILAHAAKVSAFAEQGMEAMHEPTPLPSGYVGSSDTTAGRRGQGPRDGRGQGNGAGKGNCLGQGGGQGNCLGQGSGQGNCLGQGSGQGNCQRTQARGEACGQGPGFGQTGAQAGPGRGRGAGPAWRVESGAGRGPGYGQGQGRGGRGQGAGQGQGRGGRGQGAGQGQGRASR